MTMHCKDRKCWKCEKTVKERHFCPKCTIIQPPSGNEDFFDFMRLEKKLGLCTATLRMSYYDLSRKFHPDYFQNKDFLELQYAMKHSSILNRAYFTLKNPIARVRYLMMLEGVSENKDSGSIPEIFAENLFEIQECLMDYKMILMILINMFINILLNMMNLTIQKKKWTF